MAEESFHWDTSNTKLAANLGALGFPIKTQIIRDDRSGKSETHFYIGDVSLYRPSLARDRLLKSWAAPKSEERLETQDPLHPFLQGLRVEHNYEMLLDAQKTGRKLKLVGVGGSHATEYRDGEESPAMIFARDVIRIRDLSLAAALGTLGIPVVKIEGAGRDHTYTLPAKGHPLKLADGSVGSYDASVISRRVPGKIDLELETSDPDHPLVAAYNVRAVHVQLIKHLHEEKKLLWLRPPGTGRTALISEAATNRVLDRVQKHFRVPS